MADALDSLVKGAPMPGHDPLANQKPATSGAGGLGDLGGLGSLAGTANKAGDPLSHTPGSPSMIYLNLLVLEASLRAQYLALRARRRHHTFFLMLLSGWILGFGYALFLAPREDGSGVGGSVYWVVDVLEKVCFMGGVITAALVWATGIWERGVRWPRRWFSVANRGLRHINCKLVLLKRPWYAEAVATLAWFLTYGLFTDSGSDASSYRAVDPALLREVDRELPLAGHPVLSQGHSHAHARTLSHLTHSAHGHGHEEDLAPGGDHVKLLLLAKPFSPTFRENWEIYRAEYWERENERRALIRHKLKLLDRQLRRRSGSWFWWLPARGLPELSPGAYAAAAAATEPKTEQRPHTPRGGSGSGSGSGSGAGAGSGGSGIDLLQHPRHAAVEREHRRTRSSSSRRSSMSTGASASTVSTATSTGPPTIAMFPDLDDSTRTASTASNPPERRRKKASISGAAVPGASRQAIGTRRQTGDSRSVTPEIPSPLARESSLASD